VIFLDKNHPANGLRRVIEDIEKYLKGNVVVKKLYLVPENATDDGASRLHGLPFSENFVS